MRKRRCSYCYNTGHNRAGCEELKKYLKENPNSYTARQEALKKSRRKTPSERTCSFCFQPGHNRRKCMMVEWTRRKVTEEYRKDMETIMGLAGDVGWGCLIQDDSNRDKGLEALPPRPVLGQPLVVVDNTGLLSVIVRTLVNFRSRYSTHGFQQSNFSLRAAHLVGPDGEAALTLVGTSPVASSTVRHAIEVDTNTGGELPLALATYFDETFKSVSLNSFSYRFEYGTRASILKDFPKAERAKWKSQVNPQ